MKEEASSYAPASHTFGKARPGPLLNKQNLGKIPKANTNISDDLSIYDNYGQPSIPGKDGLSRLSSNAAGSPMKQQKKGKQAEPTAREKALQFARNVPKPKAKPAGDRRVSDKQGSPRLAASPFKAEFEKLEQKHEMYYDEVAKMRREFNLMWTNDLIYKFWYIVIFQT